MSLPMCRLRGSCCLKWEIRLKLLLILEILCLSCFRFLRQPSVSTIAVALQIANIRIHCKIPNSQWEARILSLQPMRVFPSERREYEVKISKHSGPRQPGREHLSERHFYADFDTTRSLPRRIWRRDKLFLSWNTNEPWLNWPPCIWIHKGEFG